MKKTIETVNFEATDTLVQFIDQKFDNLSKYHDRLTSIDVYLKSHNGKVEEESYEVQVKGFLPGHEIFADAFANNYQEAAHEVYLKIKRQLSKAKEMDKDRREPRVVKP